MNLLPAFHFLRIKICKLNFDFGFNPNENFRVIEQPIFSQGKCRRISTITVKSIFIGFIFLSEVTAKSKSYVLTFKVSMQIKVTCHISVIFFFEFKAVTEIICQRT